MRQHPVGGEVLHAERGAGGAAGGGEGGAAAAPQPAAPRHPRQLGAPGGARAVRPPRHRGQALQQHQEADGQTRGEENQDIILPQLSTNLREVSQCPKVPNCALTKSLIKTIEAFSGVLNY